MEFQRGFFFLIASKGHFWKIKHFISFYLIFTLFLGVGLKYATYMDQILIFGSSWAQNTIFPKRKGRK